MNDNELETLGEKIKQAKTPADDASKGDIGKNQNIGMRAGSTFVSSVVAGGLVGFLLDKGLGTIPLFLMGFLLFGFGFGIFRVVKITGGKD